MTCQLFSDAIRTYKKAVFLERGNADLWGNLGYAYRTSGDLDKAVDAYRVAIKIDPKNKSACLSLGLILMAQEKYKEAIPCFEQIRQLGPESKKGIRVDIPGYYKSALRMLVTCYEALGETKKKQSVLEDFERHYPEDSFLKDRLKIKDSTLR
jgi:tetratricopeptide (TPR) repeat protein